MFSRTLVLASLVLSIACSGAKKDAAPATESPAGDASNATAQVPPGNIVDVAGNAGQFKTLTAALTAAGLVDTLAGPGPFTVFAPTDQAFAKLPAGALDKLIADPAKLEAVLLLHVVSGKVMAADAAGLDEATSMSGAKLPIDASNGVKIGGALVTTADVEASNGVIHIIDTVLLPG